MYVVMVLEDFKVEAINCPLPVKIEKGKMLGFLPVYQTKEDALLDYPDRRLIEVEEAIETPTDKSK